MFLLHFKQQYKISIHLSFYIEIYKYLFIDIDVDNILEYYIRHISI